MLSFFLIYDLVLVFLQETLICELIYKWCELCEWLWCLKVVYFYIWELYQFKHYSWCILCECQRYNMILHK